MSSIMQKYKPKTLVEINSSRFRSWPTLDRDKPCGVFYNLRFTEIEDQDVNRFSMNVTRLPFRSRSCELIKQDDQSSNLFQWISLDSAFRLSILLGIIPTNQGIAGLINYPHSADQYTRVIRYRFSSCIETLSDEDLNRLITTTESNSEKLNGNYVVGSITNGIELVLVFQFSKYEQIELIDTILEEICFDLNEGLEIFAMSLNEIIPSSAIQMKVFSNIPDLSTRSIRSLPHLMAKLNELHNDESKHRPYEFKLHPVGHMDDTKFLTRLFVQRIENYLLPLQLKMNQINSMIDQPHPCYQQRFYQQNQDIMRKHDKIRSKYKTQQQWFREYVEQITRRPHEELEIEQLINSEEAKTLQEEIFDLWDQLKNRYNKEKMISSLISHGVQYRVATDVLASNVSIQSRLQDFLSTEDSTLIIYGNDHLQKQKMTEWSQLHQKLMLASQNNSDTRPMYVDFTDCSYSIDEFKIFNCARENEDTESLRSSLSTKSGHSAQDDIDSGIRTILVVSSYESALSAMVKTFHYASKCKTYEEVHSRSNTTLVPLSTVIQTTDDQNASHFQRFRSYLITSDDLRHERHQIRLIISPPIGSAENYDQNDRYLQQISLYLTSFTQLHGICFLLKPNETTLSLSEKNNFRRLLNMFGDEVGRHLYFCSTEAQSPDYDLGSTIRLMREFLNDVLNDYHFVAQNSFFFNSHWLDDLGNRQQWNELNTWEKHRIEIMFQRSRQVLQQFFEYSFTKPDAIQLKRDNFNESEEKTRSRILLLIPLMIDEMCNLHRNIILYENKSRNQIEILAKNVEGYFAICYGCRNRSQQLLGFQIFSPAIRRIHRNHLNCRHTFRNQPLAYYQLTYVQSNDLLSENINRSHINRLNRLLEISVEFSHFLHHCSIKLPNYEDPVASALEKRIQEEQCYDPNSPSARFNETLLDRLEDLKIEYRRRTQHISEAIQRPSLAKISELIDELNRYKTISSGLLAINEWLRLVSRDREYESELLINDSV